MTGSTGHEGKRGEWRLRLYFWLMDSSLFVMLMLVISIVLGMIGVLEPDTFSGAVNAWIGLFFGLFVSLIPFFLIFAKFMRDEYAELLFRRTMQVLAYLMVLTPFIYYVVAWTNFFVTGQPDEPPAWLAWASSETKWGLVLFYFWHAYLVAFVLVFQFLRLKDSR